MDHAIAHKVVRFTITGHAPDTDAPSVEDLLDQLRDYVDLLKGVEEAASGQEPSAIVWRVVEASPISVGIEAYPKQFATNVDQRVALVMTETAYGLDAIKAKAERPAYFTNEVMLKAQKIAERVTNSISYTKVSFGPSLPEVELTPSSARNAIRNVDTILAKRHKPYQEVGSIEGYLENVGLDGRGRRIAYVRGPMSGGTIKCLVPRQASQVTLDISNRQIGDIWGRVRIQLVGRIFYDGPGEVDHMEIENVRFFRPRQDLPQIDDIIDENFTGGLTSEEYLERMRNGTLAQ